MKTTARELFVFRERPATLKTLAQLGINRQEAQDRVMGLVPEDYVSGPSPDEKYPDLEVWVFGLRAGAKEVYTKVQVVLSPPTRCVCISFHVTDTPMHYPLRKADPAANEEDRR
jgi:hypothetical protein